MQDRIIVPNESEQAKAELMHFGIAGMKWGVRKAFRTADSRAAIATGVNPMHPKARKLNEMREKIKARGWKDFDQMSKKFQDTEVKFDSLKKKKFSEVDKQPGNFLMKALKKHNLGSAIDKQSDKALDKVEGDYIMKGASRDHRVLRKQKSAATKIINEEQSAIARIAKSEPNIFKRISKVNDLDLQYTMKLQEELFRIDAEEK